MPEHSRCISDKDLEGCDNRDNRDTERKVAHSLLSSLEAAVATSCDMLRQQAGLISSGTAYADVLCNLSYEGMKRPTCAW